jgi:hypothetical protein
MRDKTHGKRGLSPFLLIKSSTYFPPFLNFLPEPEEVVVAEEEARLVLREPGEPRSEQCDSLGRRLAEKWDLDALVLDVDARFDRDEGGAGAAGREPTEQGSLRFSAAPWGLVPEVKRLRWHPIGSDQTR